MARTILVIGASGFLGRRVVEAVSAVDGVVVCRGSRRGPVLVDLADPATFSAMTSVDVVLNCSDTLTAPPLAAAEYCLAHGITFVDAGAHAPTMRGLLGLRAACGQSPGAVIAGAGLFPGVSNLLAHHVARQLPKCERLELGIAVSALSGAGAGIARLMVDGFGAEVIRYERGAPHRERVLQPGPRLPFASGERPVLGFDFPETAMLHTTLAVPSVASYYAPLPGWLRPLVRLGAWLRPRRGLLSRAYDAATLAGIRILRGLLFRWRGTGVALVAVADRGAPDERHATFQVADGMNATAAALAAMTALLVRQPPRHGVYTAGEAFELTELLAELDRWNVRGLEVSLPEPVPARTLPAASS